MTLRMIAGPATEPVTLQEAKAHLRVDGADQDNLIVRQIRAARRRVEQETGLALLPQDWEYRLDSFPADRPIYLPRPPLISVLSVETVAADGTLTTVDPSGYQLALSGWPSDQHSAIWAAAGGSWPSTVDGVRGAVRIVYRAGFPAVSAVPDDLVSAVLLAVGGLFANREDASLAKINENRAFDRLLWPYRVLSV